MVSKGNVKGNFVNVFKVLIFLKLKSYEAFCIYWGLFDKLVIHISILVYVYFSSTNPTKWSNTLKQFVSNLPANCLSVFDHFVKMAHKGLSISKSFKIFYFSFIWQCQAWSYDLLNHQYLLTLFLGTTSNMNSFQPWIYPQ